MSILIKGVEMPKNCMLCPVCVEEADPANGEMCMITGTLMPPCTRERLDNCPLVPVPEHGRLIDADALIEDLERQCKAVFRIDAVSPDDYWITRNEAYNEALWKTWVESFGKYLKTRLTIIPAEGDE